MLIEKHKQPDNVATRILSRVRDYGQANEKGKVFDRIFNKGDVLREITASKNVVGQGVQQMMFPNGMAPDGYSTFAPALGLYDGALDSTRVQDAIAENQVQLYWRKNVERCLKYNTVAGRSEVNESLIQICNEAIYKDDLDEICSLSIDSDAEIGESTQKMLHTIFRKEVLRRILNFDKDGWHYMKKLLIEGRLFFEVLYDEKSKSIVGVNMLPSQNIIVIVQDNLIIGYRQMLDGAYNQSVKTGGKNYIDFSPNQILFVDLNIYGPGGVNDPRSIIEPAMKPFNQLNTIEDSVVMYRVLWGSEKLVLKVDTSGMPKQLAEKHMKDQAKVFSRKIDYNTLTGEITNFGRAIGLSEHYIIPVSQEREHSQIERLAGGDQLGNIDDLKFFKRNLINSLMVPPGRITSLVGEKDNFSNGKIGEVTQGEVSFARLIGRYQTPIEIMIVRLFVMVLNTKQVINDDIKVQENFKVRFKRSIDAEVWTSRLTVFESMMKHTSTKDNPNGALAKQFALHYGLRITDDEYSKNKEWIKKEKAEDLGET